MERLKPYPAYRDSGILWLGKIPKHWGVKRVGDFSAIINGYPFDAEKFSLSEGFSLVRIRDLESTTTATFYAGDWVKEASIRNGDILVGMDGDFNVARWRGEGALLNQRMCCLRAKPSLDTRFLFYLLAFPLKVINDLTYSTTVKHLSSFDVAKIRFGLPPLDEQRAMAEFLDRETAKLDALVTKKEQLIALLLERRSTLISHTVTKGLNPGAPMRDSGIAWMGKIPKHWMAKRLRYCAESLQTGPFGSQLHSEDYTSGGTPLVNPAQIGEGKIIPDYECSVDEKTLERLARHQLFVGDIVFGRRGEMGRCALVTKHEVGWLCGTGSLRIRLQRDVLAPHFAFWALSTKGISEWLLLESVGTTMDNLNTEILGEIPFGVPPVDEQLKIVAFLDHETGKIDALIARVCDGIKALSEYRTALISAVVTGRIAVDASASH